MRNAEGFLCVFFCTDSAGDTNRASVFVPNGRGSVPPPRQGVALTPRGAHKRVDTCGFHPLVNHPFPLEGLAQITDM